MRTRPVLLLLAPSLAVTGQSLAQWTAISLHSSMFPYFSGAKAASEDWQGGVATLNNRTQPVLWHGSANSWASLVENPSDSGTILGLYASQQAGLLNSHAALWSGTPQSHVDLHPSGYQISAADAIWGDEQVGYVANNTSIAALWHGTAASFVNLQPAGALDSEAYAVADGQQGGVVEYMGPGGTPVQHAALWSGSAASFIDLNPAGAEGSGILGMVPGQQAGSVAFPAHSTHAAIWSGTAASMVDLAPPGSSYSWLSATCGSAQVGLAGLPSGNNAVIWFGSAQSYIDLSAFLPPGQYDQSEARGVSLYNGRYYVSGIAYRTSDHVGEAWLWIGVPAPGSVSLLALALAAATRRRRRP